MPTSLATSNMPPIPIVVLITKRLSVSVASFGSPCNTSFAKISGLLRFCRKFFIDFARRRRHDGAVSLRDRHQHVPVDRLVEREDAAIGIFKRIVKFGNIGPLLHWAGASAENQK